MASAARELSLFPHCFKMYLLVSWPIQLILLFQNHLVSSMYLLVVCVIEPGMFSL